MSNISLPEIVLAVNFLVTAILVYTFVSIIVKYRRKESELPYLIFGMMATIALLCVNIPSAFNHYIVDELKSQIPGVKHETA